MRLSTGLRRLCIGAVIAALYAALTFLGAPIAYGPVQFRISELLCILPFFVPWTSGSLFVGCILANLLSPAGVWDIILGPVASLLAALCTAGFGARWRATGELSVSRRALACLMPVVFNALIIGAMLAVVMPLASGFLTNLLIFAGEVGAGELAVMIILGFPLISVLPRLRLLKLITDI